MQKILNNYQMNNVMYEKKGSLAYVTLNRPKVLNALNQRTWEELRAAFEDARHDDDVRGVILTGAGDKAFIAGADIGELAQVTAVKAEQSSAYGQDVLNLLDTLEIEGRSFTARLLPAGESVNGFFYFQTEPKPGAKLYLTGIKDAASGQDYFYFEVPF